MRLAKDNNRIDWRAMLAGASSTEITEWAEFYEENFFMDEFIDAQFAALSYQILSFVYPKHTRDISTFSLLRSFKKVNSVSEAQEEMTDDQMMMAAAGAAGGLRIEPESR